VHVSGHFHTQDNLTSLTIWQENSRAPCRAGQLQYTGVAHESLMTRLQATVVYAYIKMGGRGTEFTRRSKLQKSTF
jgi:hypothetical protein